MISAITYGDFTISQALYQIRSDKSLSHVRLFVTPWIAACQASLSITNSRSSLRLTSIESVMPSSHLILCRPLLLLPPIPPSIRVFSNESTLRMRWPNMKHVICSTSFNFQKNPVRHWGRWACKQTLFFTLKNTFLNINLATVIRGILYNKQN